MKSESSQYTFVDVCINYDSMKDLYLIFFIQNENDDWSGFLNINHRKNNNIT